MLAPEKNPIIHGQNGSARRPKERDMLPITIPSLAENGMERSFAK